MDEKSIGNMMDRIISTEFTNRGTEPLYEAAREAIGEPLTFAASKLLSDTSSGSTVLFSTGSVTRSWISPYIGENDGPMGTAILARALAVCYDILPVVACEETLVEPMKEVLAATGFTVLSMDKARTAMENKNKGPILPAVVLPFPVTDKEAKDRALNILENLKPDSVVAIERAGMNKEGIYHNMRGYDYSQGRARFDYVMEEAQKQGISTLAVGDGGNEVGMGLIEDAVRKHVPHGDYCNCPCESGLAASTSADVLVTAAVSNWGCYAIADLIGKRNENKQVLHTPEQEDFLMKYCVNVGLIDGNTGQRDLTVDGLPLSFHKRLVGILSDITMGL